jgi:hypothetical protein
MGVFLSVSDLMGKSVEHAKSLYLRKGEISDRANRELKNVERLNFEFSKKQMMLAPEFFQTGKEEGSIYG